MQQGGEQETYSHFLRYFLEHVSGCYQRWNMGLADFLTWPHVTVFTTSLTGETSVVTQWRWLNYLFMWHPITDTQHLYFVYSKCFSAVISYVLKAVKVPRADKLCRGESSIEDKNTVREEGWAPHRQCSLNVLVLTGVHSFPWMGWFLHWNLLGRERPKGKEACASMVAEGQTVRQLWSFPRITCGVSMYNILCSAMCSSAEDLATHWALVRWCVGSKEQDILLVRWGFSVRKKKKEDHEMHSVVTWISLFLVQSLPYEPKALNKCAIICWKL